MNRCLVFSLTLMLLAAVAAAKPKDMPPYKDARLSIDERVADLLRRMTIEEKVGQLRCPMAWKYYEIKDERVETREVVLSESFRKDIDEGHIGMLWATFRAGTWTQKTLDNGLTPALAAKAANALQRYAIEHTRLGIPLFLAEEAPHGHMAIGTTVFPTGLAMAATWSQQLIGQAGEIIAKEIRAQGALISYGPVLDLARDPRWSRVEETFGEDPVLTATLGTAMVRELGGGLIGKSQATLPTLKHFIAYGASEGGQNGGATHVGRREMNDFFLPPFRKAIEAGALSVMTAYSTNDGLRAKLPAALLQYIRGCAVRDTSANDIPAAVAAASTLRHSTPSTTASATRLSATTTCTSNASTPRSPHHPARHQRHGTLRTIPNHRLPSPSTSPIQALATAKKSYNSTCTMILLPSCNPSCKRQTL